MDFEFYNVTSPPSGMKRALIPFQRMARRVLRPMLHRLRDLLTLISQKQSETADVVACLQGRLNFLEAQTAKVTSEHKALELDHLALMRRAAHLEELLLQSLAQKSDAAERRIPSLPTLGSVESSNGSFRKAS